MSITSLHTEPDHGAPAATSQPRWSPAAPKRRTARWVGLAPAVGWLRRISLHCGGLIDRFGSQIRRQSLWPELAAKTHSICLEYAERARKEIDFRGADPSSPSPLALAKFSRGIEHGARLLGEQLDELRALRPSAKARAEFERVLDVHVQLVDAYLRAARAARRGDRAGVQAIGHEVQALYEPIVNTQLGGVSLNCE